tara:strand:+ start:371 stop:841 length:471 start_codon:yes stop_codon:yes gene_type:complete
MPLTEEEKKERKREHDKRYREKNKEQIKQYREKNKEQSKQYREKNKEKMKEYMKEYNPNNKEKQKEYFQKYYQTPKGKKKRRIANWKHVKIVPNCSWDEFYDKWEKSTNCEDCGVVMTVDRYNTSTTKCPDHDHSITDGRPNFRGFVCNGCNTRRG